MVKYLFALLAIGLLLTACTSEPAGPTVDTTVDSESDAENVAGDAIDSSFVEDDDTVELGELVE